jgi:Helix-turn-helix domain
MSLESTPHTASQWLRETRTSQGWELDLVSQQTKIPVEFLRNIEDAAWDRLPGAVYARAFVRTLAGLYGIDQDEIVRMLRIELNLVPSDTAQPSEVITDFAQESHTENQMNTRKPLGVWIGFGTLAILFAGIIVIQRLPESSPTPPPAPLIDTASDTTAEADSSAVVPTGILTPVLAGACIKPQDSTESVTMLYVRDAVVHKKSFVAGHDSLVLPRDTTISFRNLSGKFLKMSGNHGKDSIGWKFFEAGSKGDSFWVKSLEESQWAHRYDSVTGKKKSKRKHE